MGLLGNIGHNLKNFQLLNTQSNNSKPKNQNGYQNKDNKKNTRGGPIEKNCGRGQISTDRKHCVVELKGIPNHIIAERKNANMCLKYRKGPHNEFECYASNPIMTQMIHKEGEVPQVWDTSKK